MTRWVELKAGRGQLLHPAGFMSGEGIENDQARFSCWKKPAGSSCLGVGM